MVFIVLRGTVCVLSPKESHEIESAFFSKVRRVQSDVSRATLSKRGPIGDILPHRSLQIGRISICPNSGGG